ncbi:MAG: DbpA RNA binding domain-containing protein [Spirochaetota bacterium]
MTRGTAQILHKSTTRGLGPLERLIYRQVRRRRDLIAEVPAAAQRQTALSLAAIARTRPHHAGVQSVVMTADGASVSMLADAVVARLGEAAVLSVAPLVPGSDARREETAIASGPDVIVATPTRLIDHIRRGSIDLSNTTTVAIDVPPDDQVEQFSADLHFIYAKLDRRPVTVALVDDLESAPSLLDDLMRRPTAVPGSTWATPTTRPPTPRTEERIMKDLPFTPEDLKTRIDDIVHSIHHDEDPVELTLYRKYARKYTTVFNRGYILAYLLKQSLEGGGRRPSRKGGQTAAADSPDKQSIFVSIGRSKRVRSRDLVAFFTSANGITQDDIGQVKVLDNYSFVEVTKEKAQAVIDELNGQELRGRKLTVNFARKK